MPNGEEDWKDWFGGEGEEEDDEPTNKERLRERGVDLPYTRGELEEILLQLLEEQAVVDASRSPEAVFEAGLQSGVGIGGFDNARRASQIQDTPEGADRRRLTQSIEDYLTGRSGGSGPTPAVIQLPTNDDLFRAVTAIAAGPSPESLYRSVFTEAFPEINTPPDPFADFVAKQESELESRFLQNVFKEFTTPGYIDTLKSDYATLERQADNQRISGAGGTVPSFEDYIRQRVSSNYMTFLAGEKPKLEQAFVLASPQQRGQRGQAELAPPRRIL